MRADDNRGSGAMTQSHELEHVGVAARFHVSHSFVSRAPLKDRECRGEKNLSLNDQLNERLDAR